jgi:hypothetical protein
VCSETFPRDPSGQTALANALREHQKLYEYHWADSCFLDRLAQVAQDVTPDCVLRALPECLHLEKVSIMTKYASADTINNLLQLECSTEFRLILETDQSWLMVADELRKGLCRIRGGLRLVMCQVTRSEATESVKTIASVIRENRNLEALMLRMENAYTDEAGAEALAEALTVIKTLCKIKLSEDCFDCNVENKSGLSASTYDAFNAMLRAKTRLTLRPPPFKSASADRRLRDARKQMVIEQRLNTVGRGRLVA